MQMTYTVWSGDLAVVMLLRLGFVADGLWPMVHHFLQCYLYVVTCIGNGYIWPGNGHRTRVCLHWPTFSQHN